MENGRTDGRADGTKNRSTRLKSIDMEMKGKGGGMRKRGKSTKLVPLNETHFET